MWCDVMWKSTTLKQQKTSLCIHPKITTLWSHVDITAASRVGWVPMSLPQLATLLQGTESYFLNVKKMHYQSILKDIISQSKPLFYLGCIYIFRSNCVYLPEWVWHLHCYGQIVSLRWRHFTICWVKGGGEEKNDNHLSLWDCVLLVLPSRQAAAAQLKVQSHMITPAGGSVEQISGWRQDRSSRLYSKESNNCCKLCVCGRERVPGIENCVFFFFICFWF